MNLTPDTAVTVEIKTGKHRVVEYFLSPLMHSGMRVCGRCEGYELTHIIRHHLMLDFGINPDLETAMRTTINLDDTLLERAQTLTGVKERSALLREALTALIQRESARRLAQLGGSQPDLSPIPRRRTSVKS